MATKEVGLVWKWILTCAVAVIVAVIIFFNFDNVVTWMTLNGPFQSSWVAVQLTDGEVLYGHLAGVSGSTIGLKDVYLLDKVTEQQTTPTQSSGDFVLGGTPTPQIGQALVPVNYTNELFIDRTSAIYFKFVAPGDPALQYLH